MELSFKDITRQNWHECIKLSTNDDQKGFVASNAFSLAQSNYEPENVPKGIYSGDQMVGFAMYAKEPETGRVWIMRLMIDKTNQGKGYGKTALQMLIGLLQNVYSCTEIYLSVNLLNHVAKRLYESFGFKSTGKIEHDEEIYMLSLVRC